ncbi:MAG: PilN domain-containing protein [Nitrosomonas sp.]|nr:PilN domain-containing protein [Nitrosomonas sp.]
MRRLRLKFPNGGQQVHSIEYLLLLFGILVLAGVFYQFKQVSEEANYWTIRVERLEKRQQPKVTHRTRSSSRNRERDISQEIQKEIVKANVILGQINLPWEALFDAIEHASNEDVALMTLQPSVDSQSLRVGGEARNMSELLDFVEALERDIIFKNVHLLNYKIKLDNPHRPIIFLLTASWIEVS